MTESADAPAGFVLSRQNKSRRQAYLVIVFNSLVADSYGISPCISAGSLIGGNGQIRTDV